MPSAMAISTIPLTTALVFEIPTALDPDRVSKPRRQPIADTKNPKKIENPLLNLN